ncbi:MAG: HDIG domain-containing protein [Planctomycetota bacterium]|nr:HDIG domain-containing protein [Planctomycetota bacterium]
MMSIKDAETLVEQHIKTKNLLKHTYAVAAIMHALALRLNQNPETWELAGLLHDLDYDETKENPQLHGIRTVEILKDYDVPQEVIDSIKAHNERKTPENLFEYAIICADNISGFLVACALVRPEKKISALTPDFVAKKMKEPSFAKGASRELIANHSRLGLSQEEFFQISIEALSKISHRLGL